MPETTSNITDAELIEKLRNSYIDEAQKTELESLVPEMNDEEKAELLNLIDKSNAEEEKHQENLSNINKEYVEELKKDDEAFRKEFEQLDKEETAEELKEIEGEIATVPNVTQSIAKEPLKKTKHTLRNLILIFFLLIALAGGILYALNYYL
ncbi:MAG: hypothetical protein ACTSXL_01785 [Alphaproteobacteria bacterium]